MGYRKKSKGKGKGKKGGGKGGKGGDVERDAESEDADEAAEGGDAKRARTGDGKGAQQKHPNDVWREGSGDIVMENAGYEAYYKRMGICPEADWARMMETLRTGLPAAMRINTMRAGHQALNERLREMVNVCSGDADRECYAPEQLKFYPDGLGWHWRSLDRTKIKKDGRHVRLKNYLSERERRGMITRQEVVSQLPPLFLSVEPHHYVLDMCAAPGSKTTQMIELMHRRHAAEGGPPPTGMVMANELQWRRANMLAHQVVRSNSPCAAIVNMDAQYFPELWDGDAPFRFDRVLCDVPCSGDGTMRKTPFIWNSWTWKDGLALHMRQLNILYRGLDLLKVGGQLVYSTCSLNPMEDESVVHAALARHGATLRVVPRPAQLEGKISCTSGLESWPVPSCKEEGVYYATYEEVPNELKHCKLRLLPSMFPPLPDAENDDRRKQIREGCCRFLPHLMDTGGFFVTCFEKVAEFKPSAKARRIAARKAGDEKRLHESREPKVPAADGDAAAAIVAESSTKGESAAGSVEQQEQEEDDEVDEVDDADAAEAVDAAEPAGAVASKKEPPTMRVLTKDFALTKETIGDEWGEICEFYGLDAAALESRFYIRNSNCKQAEIFLQSEGLAHLLRTKTRLPTRMVLTGVLAFKAAGNMHVRACSWSLEQEGVVALCALGLKRRLELRRPLLRRLLTERELPLSELHAAAAQGDVGNLDFIVDASESSAETRTLRPGKVALQLLPYKDGEVVDILPAQLHNVALVANISEGAIELACTNAQAAAILEDIAGQPSVDDILGAAVAVDDTEDVPMPKADDSGA